eukprot:TRINITY_DN1135_c0_g1_i4.p1 TRINITY_DN1135_c0_g1~~TRINITY_DN1135_c0_g1_i4.p1  ORF type:complete len:273 (+),score=82.12 TRINITY_DN1135_c0_g1_i4:161-979(+)
MRFLIAAGLAALVAVSHATSIPFKKCGDGILELKNLDANPFPVQKGGATTLTATGTLSKDFLGGEYTIKVSVDGLQILTKTGDACSLTGKVNCPVKAGDATLSDTLQIPAIAPSGAYHIEVSAVNTDKTPAFCFSSDFTLATDLTPNAVFTNVPFTTCGSGDFNPSGLDISPWPPVKGQPVTIKASGHLAKQVTAGQYKLDVALDGIDLIQKNGDLCKISPDLKCPQDPADLTIGYSVAVPSIAPSGSYVATFQATQQDSKTLFCAKVPFTL